MFELNNTTVMIVALVVLLYGLDKLVTWYQTKKAIEAAEKQVPIEGVMALFQGFAQLPMVKAGYGAVVSELKEAAAKTANPWDDMALEWFDETTGKRWFREDAVADDIRAFKRVAVKDTFSDDTAPLTVSDDDRMGEGGEPPGPYSGSEF